MGSIRIIACVTSGTVDRHWEPLSQWENGGFFNFQPITTRQRLALSRTTSRCPCALASPLRQCASEAVESYAGPKCRACAEAREGLTQNPNQHRKEHTKQDQRKSRQNHSTFAVKDTRALPGIVWGQTLPAIALQLRPSAHRARGQPKTDEGHSWRSAQNAVNGAAAGHLWGHNQPRRVGFAASHVLHSATSKRNPLHYRRGTEVLSLLQSNVRTSRSPNGNSGRGELLWSAYYPKLPRCPAPPKNRP